uniref:Dolichol kinase n=1 Tax=Trichuris muris TaxID=70415 RepID=A0A5S6QFR9_TRIMR
MTAQDEQSRDSHFSAELDRRLSAYLSTSDVVPFKTGLYTALMLAFLTIAGCCIFAVYCLLHAFVKPIMWAVLVGTVLFPMKLAFSKRFELWLDDLEKTDTPFIFGLVALPWHFADCGLASVVNRVATKSSLVLLTIYFLLWCFSRSSPLWLVLSWLQRMWHPVDVVISYGSSPKLLILMLFYFSILCTSIKILGDKANKIIIRILSVPIWFSVLCYIGNFFGAYRLPVTVSLAGLIAAISLDVFNKNESPSKSSKKSQEKPKPHINYTESIVGAAVLVFLLKYNYLFFFLGLLALCVLAMKAGRYLLDNDMLTEHTAKLTAAVHGPLKMLYEIWIPHQMRTFLSAWLLGSPALYSRLHRSAGILSTLVVMALMFFGLLTLSIFLLVQVSALPSCEIVAVAW